MRLSSSRASSIRSVTRAIIAEQRQLRGRRTAASRRVAARRYDALRALVGNARVQQIRKRGNPVVRLVGGKLAGSIANTDADTTKRGGPDRESILGPRQNPPPRQHHSNCQPRNERGQFAPGRASCSLHGSSMRLLSRPGSLR